MVAGTSYKGTSNSSPPSIVSKATKSVPNLTSATATVSEVILAVVMRCDAQQSLSYLQIAGSLSLSYPAFRHGPTRGAALNEWSPTRYSPILQPMIDHSRDVRVTST